MKHRGYFEIRFNDLFVLFSGLDRVPRRSWAAGKSWRSGEGGDHRDAEKLLSH